MAKCNHQHTHNLVDKGLVITFEHRKTQMQK